MDSLIRFVNAAAPFFGVLAIVSWAIGPAWNPGVIVGVAGWVAFIIAGHALPRQPPEGR